MITWGINSLNHGSSLAIFEHDQLIENIVSNNNTLSFPEGKPDIIYWYEQPWLKKFRQLKSGQYDRALDMSVLPRSALKSHGLHNIPIIYTSHHASHASAGYYTSPFDHCAVVVLDAIGEFECASIWEGRDGNLKKVWSRSYPNSLGLFYSAFTKLIGLQPVKEEYLLQEMSIEGDPNRFYEEVKKYMSSTLRCNFNLHKGVQDWNLPINNLRDRKDIAAAVQLVFEDQVDLIMSIARNLTQSKNLVYMGGCALNSKANKKVVKGWDYVWSLPNPGDPSSSIGAVLYHTKNRIRNFNFGSVSHIDINLPIELLN